MTAIPEKKALVKVRPRPQAETIESTSIDLDQLERVYSFLQQASEKGWHLPSSVIRSITGATPRGQVWKRYGFEFTPATRHGGERAWAVDHASWDFPIHGG